MPADEPTTDPLAVLVEVVTAAGPAEVSSDHAARLLIDYEFCRRLGTARVGGEGWPQPWAPTPAEAAARAGELAHLLDWDDVHWPSVVHPGAVIWPVVQVLGRELATTGPQLLKAAAAGYEVSTRVGAALGPQHRRRFHSTATAGTVGVAATTAVLLDLSPTQIELALGHAISVMGGSAGSLRERSDTRAFHRGHAIRSGIAAALAGAAGLSATRNDLSAGGGVIENPGVDFAARLGQDQHALDATQVRVFPTSGWNQVAYATARAAAADVQSSIHSIEVVVSPAVEAITRSARPDELWVRLDWAVAQGMRTSVNQKAADLCGLVKVVSAPDAAATGRVLVRLHAESRSFEAELSIADLPGLAGPVSLAAKWQLTPSTAGALIADVGQQLMHGGSEAQGMIERFLGSAFSDSARSQPHHASNHSSPKQRGPGRADE